MDRLLGKMRKAIEDYGMIEDGDRIAVGVSGGKDSVCLLAALNRYRRYSPQRFDLVAITVDAGFGGASVKSLERLHDYIESLHIPHSVLYTDIAEIVFNEREESSPCSLCGRMRRGALCREAVRQECNKLALGHHADDALHTLLLSLFYEGRFSTFQPLSYMARSDITLIRPFVYIGEKDITGAARKSNLPYFKNPCPADGNTRREDMAKLVKLLNKKMPFARERMIAAIHHPERNNLWVRPDVSGNSRGTDTPDKK